MNDAWISARGARRADWTNDGRAWIRYRPGLVVALLLTLLTANGVPLTLARASTGSQWINISPPISLDPNNPTNNFGTQTIVMDPQHTQTLYVGTCYQGLWKTTNGGTSWIKINTGTNGNQLDAGRLWSVAIDPSNPNTLYTTSGYGTGGVWKSTDGGVDWQNMLTGSSAVGQQLGTTDAYHIEIDPANTQHLLVSFHYFWNPNGNTSPGILESIDGGQNWTVHTAPVDWGTGDYVFFIGNSSTWLVATQNDGFWRTANSGGTWQQVSTTSMTHGAEQLVHAADGSYYAAGFGPIVRSTDGGMSWASVNNNLPWAGYNAVVSDGTTLYTAPAFPSLGTNQITPYYISTDGQNWSAQGGGSQTFTNGPMSMVYDPVNHVIYSSNWDGGVWKLQTGSITPTPTSGPSTPTATATHVLPTATSTPSATSTRVSTTTPTATHVPATSTSVPATATRTNTPIPATTTRTNTPIPATATRTNTPIPPTSTATPVPPTATATATPVIPTATSTTVPVVPTATATSVGVLPTVTPTVSGVRITVGRTTLRTRVVAPGTTEVFTTTVTANRSMTHELVVFAVYNSAGKKIYQTVVRKRSFKGGVATAVSGSWVVPVREAVGTYRLAVGVLTAGWSVQAWNGRAATFSVSRMAGVSRPTSRSTSKLPRKTAHPVSHRLVHPTSEPQQGIRWPSTHRQAERSLAQMLVATSQL